MRLGVTKSSRPRRIGTSLRQNARPLQRNAPDRVICSSLAYLLQPARRRRVRESGLGNSLPIAARSQWPLTIHQ